MLIYVQDEAEGDYNVTAAIVAIVAVVELVPAAAAAVAAVVCK